MSPPLCKIINLGDKIDPPPPVPEYHFLGVGGGVVQNNFFLVYGPVTNGGGLGSKLRGGGGGWALASQELNAFRLACFLAEHFRNFDFFQNPFVACGMGLGDHLVTVWVV